ncbi:MAG TPA: amidase family protein [Candidatus Binatia bacterium]|jgi:Asp-tRNA(Asn)/Glu-tRNA(Gln) amidotransferase A subunit family amidase|nr:amidase family protein [Candidatus Binatia bacterium]
MCRTDELGTRKKKKLRMDAPTVMRRLWVGAACVAALGASPAVAQTLDLETLDAQTAEQMMAAGKLTSVRLVQAYIDRIEALNKRGPGLNAVTQLNKDALKDAAKLDKERAKGVVRGPAHGLPVLVKDLIDVKGMYTSNGNYSLRNSFPEDDSGIVKKLRASGVIILGKLGLSEYANSFGNQPSGFSNLTGQVLHAFDADQNPSGSSSGSGAAGAAALSMLTIGTETSGSIISPSGAESLVGIRPTVGLVPAYGIGPISSSQDTAGPMDRSVANAAINLQSMAGRDLKNEAGYAEVFGANWEQSIKKAPEPLPDYISALDLNFVAGKRIGYNGTFDEGSPAKLAYDALEAAGAIMVERPQIAVGDVPPLPGGYQQHNAINLYYRNLGPLAPIKSLAEEVADNLLNEHEALKFGNNAHANALAAEVAVGGPNQLAYQAAMPIRRAAQWLAIDSMMNNQTPGDPSDDFLAILGNVPSGATAGTPQITIPMGYSATQRRAVSVSIHGNALSERNLIGVAYVIEQGTKLRQSPSALNPSMYRCAKTTPRPPYNTRGDCNPTYDNLDQPAKNAKDLGFALELESVESLQARMTAGTLLSYDLTKAYLARIAMSNAEGPAIQAVRMVKAATALSEANRLDNQRKRGLIKGPLHGIPVLLSDVIDAADVATTGGSIALQKALARKNATLVAKLEAAGAIILGKTNVTELNGIFDSNLTEGYSSLGGQVLLPSDTDKMPAGSSAGSAAATAAGLAALTIGLETSTDSAQIIAPAGVAGVVGLKPTVGLVSRDGVLPVAKSQDSPGPITRTVYDAALALEVIAGEDPADGATSGAPTLPDYLSGLTPTALAGKRVAVIASTTAPYPNVVSAIQALGATTVVKTIGTPSPNPPSIVLSEFERDLNAYLSTLKIPKGDPTTLEEIIAYNVANPVEGLKYQQRELLDAAAIDLTDPATEATYEADKAAGLASNKAVIDGLLNNGTPEDPADDIDVIVVPSGNALVGIADRAGYPVLTVPAGYGTGGAGRNPIGVTFVGKAFGEGSLLAAGYAYEQASNVRLAPSFTNPSMWRCVPGSDFFSPHHCHPGDLLASK